MLAYESNELYDYVLKYNKNSFFIEAGAHDGVTQSNTLKLEKEFGWSGLLIEAGWNLVQKCKINRSAPVEYTALVNKNYNKSTICGNFLSDSPISSIDTPPDYFLNNELLITEFKDRASKYQIEVPANTLDTVLLKYNIQHIDFFSLDIEGYELDILKDFDFNKFSINILLVETANRPFYQNLTRDYLDNRGFKFIKQITGNDDLFIRKELI